MKDLSLIQKYDAVLDVLYEESGNSPTFSYIEESLKKKNQILHWGEIWDILNTLIGDGLVYKVDQDNEHGVSFERYLLSFNGKLSKESGGLGKKLQDEKTKQTLSTNQLNAAIDGVKWTKWNIKIALLLSAITTSVVISTFVRDTNRYNKESETKLKDKQQAEEINKSIQELKKELHQISLSLKDTAPMRIKIEK